ncbi:hypothetical protein [Sorangium sp. So ce1078]|uniref:hypothetical protein n=1 Tax=Sorangium sp. So ce1078 TaxID=3133329 RepID=UPI003F63237C
MNLPELLEKIKATPDGPERRMLVGEYITAAHHADKTIGAKAMRDLDEAMSVR